MEVVSTLSFILLVIITSTNVLLGIVVLKNNSRSVTNRIYSLLSVFISIWLMVLFLSEKEVSQELFLLLARLSIFIATPMSMLFFLLAHTLPGDKFLLKRKYKITIFAVTILVMLLNISPFAFSGVETVDRHTSVIPGPGIMPFSFLSTFFSAGAVFLLIRKFRYSTGIQKQQFRFILLGVLLMLGLVIVTIMLPVLFLKNASFIALSPLYALIFLGFTAYAIVKHHLFNIKVIATEALVIIIWLVLFAKIFVSATVTERIVDGIIFVATIPFGILLVRSVIREVKLAQQQYEMVATVSHQLRTPLTPIIGLASMILDGDFDKSATKRRAAEEKIFIAGKRLANVINDFLQVFELEGDRRFDKDSFDIISSIKEAMEAVKNGYESKGLYLRFKNSGKAKPKIKGEPRLFTQAISNLLDNAEKYTPKGGTTIALEHSNRGFMILISDTGIGLDPEAKQRMFQKFFRSEAARKIRPDGSGLGLPIVKKIIEAHGGKISVDSPGPDKGTVFTITFHRT